MINVRLFETFLLVLAAFLLSFWWAPWPILVMILALTSTFVKPIYSWLESVWPGLAPLIAELRDMLGLHE